MVLTAWMHLHQQGTGDRRNKRLHCTALETAKWKRKTYFNKEIDNGKDKVVKNFNKDIEIEKRHNNLTKETTIFCYTHMYRHGDENSFDNARKYSSIFLLNLFFRMTYGCIITRVLNERLYQPLVSIIHKDLTSSFTSVLVKMYSVNETLLKSVNKWTIKMYPRDMVWLTHWNRTKMADILQTQYPNSFSIFLDENYCFFTQISDCFVRI